MRKTRDNFRDLWLEWGSKLWKELFDERKAIEYNENGMLKKPNEWSKEEKSNNLKKLENLKTLVIYSLSHLKIPSWIKNLPNLEKLDLVMF